MEHVAQCDSRKPQWNAAGEVFHVGHCAKDFVALPSWQESQKMVLS